MAVSCEELSKREEKRLGERRGEEGGGRKNNFPFYSPDFCKKKKWSYNLKPVHKIFTVN